MIRTSLFILTLLGSLHFVFGQDRVPEIGPDLVIKNGTSSLLNPVLPSVTLGLEYYISNDLSIHVEGGPAINFRFLADKPEFDKTSGYRLNAAIRKYFYPVAFDHTGFFMEGYVSWFTIDATIAGDFRRNNEFGRYVQRLNYNMERNRGGIHGNFGFQSIDRGGFTIELGMGIGALWRQDRYSGVPDDAKIITNGSVYFSYNNLRDDGEWIIAPAFYMKMGYALSFQ